MSTKSSLFYHHEGDEYIHFFEDCGDPEVFYLQKIETSEVKYKFSLEELCLLAKTVDLAELERLTKLSDDQIVDHVTKQVDDRMKKDNNFLSMFGFLTFGSADDPREVQIAHGCNFYMAKRDSLKRIFDSVSSKKISKIDYGMPM